MNEALVNRLLNASRKGIFRSRQIFEPYKTAGDTGLDAIERDIGVSLPASLRTWLLKAGFCDLDEIGFRREFFRVIDRGALSGHIVFAVDVGGNFYTFNPDDGCISFISRSAPEYAVMANNFTSFMEGLETHDFRLQAWTDELKAMPYDWAV